ncbi:DnaJ-like, subfamily C, domain-containing protein [Desulfovibrio sp. X2]|uniref:DnaJ family domain-containing protein n=1 Tax=Desulfovibrio sp. X2 TaxID=941449 RepID=UPI000358B10E|nr:DnaJ family domain-containing protein [Desulfovibrio sp. X2]EPR44006.1 DnaJ-like, subfamily C, domain-containing protein [Desulfovibrio sp. X2]
MFSAIHIIAEERIKEAERNGEFKDLQGQGSPLSLDEYFSIPEELRMAYTMLRNSGHLPEDAATLRDIETTRDLLAHLEDESEKQRQIQKLNYLTMKLNMARKRSVDLEEADAYYARIVDRVTVRGGK